MLPFDKMTLRLCSEQKSANIHFGQLEQSIELMTLMVQYELRVIVVIFRISQQMVETSISVLLAQKKREQKSMGCVYRVHSPV